MALMKLWEQFIEALLMSKTKNYMSAPQLNL